ncbi:MAG TPA: ABC transporter substrate binding protein [Chloroflexota bacterium]|nr:ABC transporter substrate binding protein [Chloroflexota bacterium]
MQTHRRYNRRRFFQRGLSAASLVLLVGCATQTPPKPAQPNVYRLGLFHVGLDHVPPSLQALRDGLRELGYEEGKNITLDWRNLPDEEAANVTAREFLRDRVDLIVAVENQTLRATKAATTEIPTVFLHVDDPVANGMVESYSRPGGNLTGFVGQPDLPDKRLQLFKEVVPTLRTVLVLADLRDPVSRSCSPRRIARRARSAWTYWSVRHPRRLTWSGSSRSCGPATRTAS